MWLFQALPATVTETFECSFLVCAHWAMIGFLTACHRQALNRLYRETSSFKAKFQIGTHPKDVRRENGGVGRECGGALQIRQECVVPPLKGISSALTHPWLLWEMGKMVADARVDGPRWRMIEASSVLPSNDKMPHNLRFPANKIWRRVTQGMWNTVARQHCIGPGSEAIHWSSFPRGSSSFGASKIPARYMSKSECCHS